MARVRNGKVRFGPFADVPETATALQDAVYRRSLTARERWYAYRRFIRYTEENIYHLLDIRSHTKRFYAQSRK
jgi:hypothetical protein